MRRSREMSAGPPAGGAAGLAWRPSGGALGSSLFHSVLREDVRTPIVVACPFLIEACSGRIRHMERMSWKADIQAMPPGWSWWHHLAAGHYSGDHGRADETSKPARIVASPPKMAWSAISRQLRAPVSARERPVLLPSAQDCSQLSWGSRRSCYLHFFSGRFLSRLNAQGVWLGSSRATASLFGGTDGLESRQAARLGVARWNGAAPGMTCSDVREQRHGGASGKYTDVTSPPDIEKAALYAPNMRQLDIFRLPL